MLWRRPPTTNDHDISDVGCTPGPAFGRRRELKLPSNETIEESHVQRVTCDSPFAAAIVVPSQQGTPGGAVSHQLRMRPAAVCTLEITRS